MRRVQQRQSRILPGRFLNSGTTQYMRMVRARARQERLSRTGKRMKRLSQSWVTRSGEGAGVSPLQMTTFIKNKDGCV